VSAIEGERARQDFALTKGSCGSTRAAAAESKGQDRRLANHEKMIAALSSDNEALALEKMELKTLLAQQERKNKTLIKESDGLQRALEASVWDQDKTAAKGTGMRFEGGQLPSAHPSQKQLVHSLRDLLVPSTSTTLVSSSCPGRTSGGEGLGKGDNPSPTRMSTSSRVAALEITDASPEHSLSGRGPDESDVGDDCDVNEGGTVARGTKSAMSGRDGDALGVLPSQATGGAREIGGDAST